MEISSANLKRQILASAPKSPIKREVDENPAGIKDGEYIEWGNDLEATTRTRGYNLMEAYMLKKTDPVLLVSDNTEESKYTAKAYIDFMQWVKIMIDKKNEILQKEREKYAKTENVPE